MEGRVLDMVIPFLACQPCMHASHAGLTANAVRLPSSQVHILISRLHSSTLKLESYRL